MGHPIGKCWSKVAEYAAKSIACLALVMLSMGPARAHETQPAVADIQVFADHVEMSFILNGEALVAGIDLSAFSNTNDAPQAVAYDRLRALTPLDFSERLAAAWPDLADGFILTAGETRVAAELISSGTVEALSPELPRESEIVIRADLPADGSDVTFAWDRAFGPVILRQIAPNLPEDQDAYAAFLAPGQVSAPLPREGSAEVTFLMSVANYIWLGFTHIIPIGLDHILFVLGLYFFSREMRPLLQQVTAFTVAHTLTLALATLGLVQIPAAIVEPLIALSIAYVAIENILRPRLSKLRLIVVFAFGLLHGLGFASVLGDIGLSPGHFITSLIAFNIGVELGQLAIILVAALSVGIWFGDKPWFRPRIVVPTSLAIGLMGLWWTFERVIL